MCRQDNYYGINSLGSLINWLQSSNCARSCNYYYERRSNDRLVLIHRAARSHVPKGIDEKVDCLRRHFFGNRLNDPRQASRSAY